MRQGEKNSTALILLSIISAFFLLFPAAGLYDEISAKNRICVVNMPDINKKSISLHVEIADNNTSRQTGLMFRKSLAEDSGMLFVFENEQRLNFWMKNTYIPLSIAYIDKYGFIKDILSMKPLDISRTYPSSVPAMYALEVNEGWFKKNNITAGCRINLNGCLGK